MPTREEICSGWRFVTVGMRTCTNIRFDVTENIDFTPKLLEKRAALVRRKMRTDVFLLLLLLRSQSFASAETYAFTLSIQLKINSKNIWIVCKEYETTNIFMARTFTL